MSAKWKILTSLLVLSFVLTLWYFYDEPLDAETKEWLIKPPAIEAGDDVRLHIRTLHQISPASLFRVVGNNSCLSFSLECAKFVEAHREEIKERLSDDPEYWLAFERALDATGISGDLSLITNNQLIYGDYMAAVQLLYIRELVEFGRIRPGTAIKILLAQRYFLAKAPFLIDKMIFIATTGIAFTGLSLAQISSHPDDPMLDQITKAAKPLTLSERSFERVFKSELRYFRKLIVNDFPFPGEFGLKPGHALNLQRKAYSQVVGYSEFSENDFWKQPKIDLQAKLRIWNWFVDPVFTSHASGVTYTDYLIAIRLLDINATVIRGWGELIKDNKELAKDFPDEPIPPGWKWEWEDTALCLKSTPEIPWADPKDYARLPAPSV